MASLSDRSARWWRLLAAVCVVASAGCPQAGLRTAALPTPAGMTSAGAGPSVTLPGLASAPLPSFSNPDPRQLEADLARSRQETQLVRDEVAALREQLAATSSQLASARAVARPATEPAGATAAPAAPIGAASMQEAMAQLSIPGATARLDGGVVRVELPADALFEPGTAALLPSGTALLTQSAEELRRVFGGQFVGIEGHTDNEPLQDAAWGSAHQLSVARASAVFDFLTTRTGLGRQQLFVVAHGPNHPVVSNATAAGRARNRRIELVVYPDLAAASAASADADTAPPGAGG